MGNEQPQRAAMDGHALDVSDDKSMPGAKVCHCTHGVVAEMFVIDGVEFELVDEVTHIRCLDDGDTASLQQRGDPGDEAVGIGNMGENVVGVDHVSAAALRCEAEGELLVKELDKRRDALSGRERSDVCRWLDAKDGDATSLVELQQVAVVACDLDNEARGPETAVANQRFDQKTRMLDHGVREGRRIGVIVK